MSALAHELKLKIIAALALPISDPASVPDDASLFAGGLGLDSIDILEIVVLIEADYA